MKEKKRIYVQLIETLVWFGYDISDMLNPVYKKLSIDGMKSYIQELHDRHGVPNEYQ